MWKNFSEHLWVIITAFDYTCAPNLGEWKIIDKKITTKRIDPVGDCFVKKAIPKIMGKKNQKILRFVFNAKIKQKIAILER